MKKQSYLLILTTFLLCFSTKSFSQDSLRVLFLGNSLTYTHDIPNLIQQLAQSDNQKFSYNEHLPGGWTLYYHHLKSSISKGLIASEPWDYVIFQGQSQELLYMNEPTNYKSIRRMVSMFNHDCTRSAFYSTAAPNTLQKELQGYIHRRYKLIANEVDGLLIPVGLAFEMATDKGIAVYADKVHPNLKGSYLAACVFYAAFYQKSPIGLSFLGGLPATEALALQTIADQAVMPNFKDLNIYANQSSCSNPLGLPKAISVLAPLFTIYPNPAKRTFTLKIENEQDSIAKISVHNMQGQKVQQSSILLKSGEHEYYYQIDFPPGIYTLSISTKQYQYPAQKISIQ